MKSSARRVALASLVLLCAAVVASGPLAAQPTELFFSEYVEGSSFNKAVEIYNGTGAPVDLSAGGYTLMFYSNGSTSASFTLSLVGTVPSGGTWVVAPTNANATILGLANQTFGIAWFNGDDAVALRKGGSGGAIVDVVGQIGFDPGSQWGTGLTSTADNTMRRKGSVCAGDTDGSNAFDPAVEWDGFAVDTFGGLGSHTVTCRATVINEFSASTAGTDVEFVEVFGPPSTNLSNLKILEIEGDSGTSLGTVDEVVAVGTTDANGYWLGSLAAGALENGTITLLLVEGFSGALGNDLDTNDDGVFDTTPWTRIVDAVAVNDGGAGDRTYGVPALGAMYDGLAFAPGGASRIPDGTDTDTAADWVRNDFDLAGIPGFAGTPIFGEAYNTPGGANVRVAAAEAAPGVDSTTPADGAPSASPFDDIVVSFTEPVAFTGASFTLDCPAGTPIAFTVSGSGTTTARINPTAVLPAFTACAASVVAANVTDVDASDPPDTMAANFPWGFTTGSATPTLSINDASVIEGNSGQTLLQFTITLSAAIASNVQFEFTTADGTATTADNDYFLTSEIPATIPAGNTTYPFAVAVNGDTTPEPNETFFVNVSNPVNATIADGQGVGTILNDDVPVVEIFQIQGSGAASPFATQLVTTSDNVVTAVGPEGFFIQTPDARADADPDTSNGIYVFTGSVPTVAVGDVVDVTGTVTEYFNFTEFSPVASVTIDSSGNPLPTVVELDATLPPTDPTAAWWTIGFERLEGMLVHVANGVTSGPNQRFASDLSAEIHGVASASRPFREPGIKYPGLVGLPVWDGNPEVFEIDPDRLGAVADPDYVAAGSTYSATGVMGYEFSGWELWPTSVAFTPPALPRPVRARDAGEFTVGTYNLYLLDSTASDYAARLQKHSAYIRTVLGAPDVIGVQECQSLTELTALAARIHADDATLTYAAYLVEGHDVGGIDVGFLVRDSVSVATVTQLGYNEIFAWDGSFLHDRPPLLLEATYVGNGVPFAFTVMVNHTRSLNSIDDPVDGPRVRAKRLAQAQSIAQMIQDYQTANPLRPFAMVGDLNAYEISDGYVDVVGQMAGDFVPADNLLSGPDLVDPNLTKQALNVPAGDRYSYNFAGTAQVLDHALTTQVTNIWVRGFEYGRGNTDSAVNLLYDAGTPLRSSDHDGAVLFLMSDANADGVPDDLSPAALAATKIAAGSFVPGSLVTYTVVLGNTSAFAQLDNPGDELTDVLPAPLALVSATASSGTAVATVLTNTVTWNGTIPAGGTVTVTISAAVPLDAVVGTTISNQATVSYDADGDGTNETVGVSDDPATTSAGDATVFAVSDAGSSVATIPVLDGVGLGLLAALVALGGALLLGRRIS